VGEEAFITCAKVVESCFAVRRIEHSILGTSAVAQDFPEDTQRMLLSERKNLLEGLTKNLPSRLPFKIINQ
jgi:hypothetical protein